MKYKTKNKKNIRLQVLNFEFKISTLRFHALSFTLIEFLVYIAILTIIITGLGGIVWNMLGGGKQINAREEVSSNSRFVLNRITYEVREAKSINSPARGTASTTLSLEMANPEKNPTIFYLDNGTLKIQQGAARPVNLTSGSVEVSNLQFKNISATGTPGTIFVSFTLSFKNPTGLKEYNVTKTFQTTINLLPK